MTTNIGEAFAIGRLETPRREALAELFSAALSMLATEAGAVEVRATIEFVVDDPQAQIPPTIRLGTKGPTVEQWHRVLESWGYTLTRRILEAIDHFGTDTVTATRTFQSDHGLTVDAIVGPKTWSAARHRRESLHVLVRNGAIEIGRTGSEPPVFVDANPEGSLRRAMAALASEKVAE